MARRILLIGGVTALLLAGLWSGLVALQRYDREQTRLSATQSAENLALAFEENVYGLLASSDWALLQLRDGFTADLAAGGNGIDDLRHGKLPPFAIQLAYIDAKGVMRYSNLSSTEPVDLSDREHFRVQLDPAQDRMFVSRPVFGRVSGVWSIQLTRKVFAPDGSFAGVLVLSVDRRYFIETFDRLQIGRKGIIALIGMDRWMRARGSHAKPPGDPYSVPVGDRPFFMPDSPNAAPLQLVSQTDEEERIGAYRKVREYPLVAIVLYARDEVMHPQAERAATMSRIGLVGTVLIVLAAGLMGYLLVKRDQARQAAVDNDARWRLALEVVGDGVWDWRTATGEVSYSAGYARMLGYAAEEFGPTVSEWETRLHPDEAPAVIESLRAHLDGRTPSFQHEYRMLRKDGSYAWVLDRACIVERRPDGRPLRVIGLHSDISARRELQEQLARRDREMQELQAAIANREVGLARRRLSEAQRVARLGTLERGPEAGTWVPCQHAKGLLEVAELSGDGPFTLQELLVQVADSDRADLVAALERFPQAIVDVEFTVCAEGESRIVHAIGSRLAEYGHQGAFITLQDVTARREAERERASIRARLEETSRLESLGILAGGIAHEINTPAQFVGDNVTFLERVTRSLLQVAATARQLVAAGNGTDLLAQRIEEANLDFVAEEIPKAFEDTLVGIERISAIVRAVKQYSYPSDKTARPFNLNAAVETAVTVTRNQWKYVAEVDLELAGDLPQIDGIEGEINQVVVNLIVNAAHAIAERQAPGRGRITVRTRSLGDEIELSVTDTGVGIPKETIGRLFELFFTTKPPGQGTGQGLAISKAIVLRHGGTIEVESEPDSGACFRVRLPVAGVQA